MNLKKRRPLPDIPGAVSRLLRKSHATDWLVDTENVGGHWQGILEKAAPGDTVVLFWTESSGAPRYAALAECARKRISVEFVECCRQGQKADALDFQLSSVLGYRIAGNPGHRFVVVSNDAGFDYSVSLWMKRGMDVSRMGLRYGNPDPINGKPEKEDMPVTAEEAKAIGRNHGYYATVVARLRGQKVSKDDAPGLARVLLSVLEEGEDETALTRFHSRCQVLYGKQASAMYQKGKPVLKKILDGTIRRGASVPA